MKTNAPFAEVIRSYDMDTSDLTFEQQKLFSQLIAWMRINCFENSFWFGEDRYRQITSVAGAQAVFRLLDQICRDLGAGFYWGHLDGNEWMVGVVSSN